MSSVAVAEITVPKCKVDQILDNRAKLNLNDKCIKLLRVAQSQLVLAIAEADINTQFNAISNVCRNSNINF